MFFLHQSNLSEKLALQLAQLLRRKSTSQNIFTARTVLVQSSGMGEWLRQQIALQNGIATNLEFEFPASWFWRLAADGLARVSADSNRVSEEFNKDVLRWRIYKLLPELLASPDFSVINSYLYRDARDNYSNKELFTLSQQVADVFDGYQVYRPDWLTNWESGKLADSEDNNNRNFKQLESWQAKLWSSLCEAIAGGQHRGQLLNTLISHLEQGNNEIVEVLPDSLFIFGLSSLPPQWLRLTTLISRYVDVHLLVLNPCKLFWGDIETGLQQARFTKKMIESHVEEQVRSSLVLESHPLLASWGRLGREYIQLLQDNSEVHETSDYLFVDVEHEEPLSALNLLQQDILNLQSPGHKVSSQDRSIVLARSYSDLREVEALWDYLVNLLDRHDGLEFRDIVVMMPDVDRFAPLIRAVFAQPALDNSGQQQFLPFSITDSALSAGGAEVKALLSVISLHQSRFTVAEILDLLEYSSIRKKFNLQVNDIQMIEAWAQEDGVRWGFDAGHISEILNHESAATSHSWMHGLLAWVNKRIGEDQASIGNLKTRSDTMIWMQPRDYERLLEKLVHLLGVLEWTINSLKGNGGMGHWNFIIRQLVDAWFEEDETSVAFYSEIESSLETLQRQSDLADLGSIEFCIYRDALEGQLSSSGRGQGFLSGRINFCTLMPLRSIPFKVICLIGMNERDYPRQTLNNSLDLIGVGKQRAGDRDPREEDRYLFLECILSARDALYFGYQGNAAKDNSERLPSVLLSELIEYCQNNFYLDGMEHDPEAGEKLIAHWTVEHRLQVFHPAYYGVGEKGLSRSFQGEWLALYGEKQGRDFGSDMPITYLPDDVKKTEAQACENPVTAKNPKTELIYLDSLQEFMAHPLKYYYQRTIGVDFGFDEDVPSDNEAFDLDYLQQYKLKQTLLFESVAGRERAKRDWISHGWLPDSVAGHKQFHELLDLTERSLSVISTFLPDLVTRPSGMSELEFNRACLKNIPISLDVNHQSGIPVGTASVSLAGSVTLSDSGYVEISLSSKPGREFSRFWLMHLVCNALDLSPAQRCSHFFYSTRKNKALVLKYIHCLPLASETALELLAQWVTCYRESSCAPYAWLPKTGFCQMFESEKTAYETYFETNGILGEQSDGYWRRYQEDPYSYPDFSASLLPQQLGRFPPEVEELAI